MSDNFTLNAVLRPLQGKGASRRLRKQELVPAIIYGGEGEPLAISLKANELRKDLENEAFFSHILTINVEGHGEEAVIIKALQRHPAKNFAMHADFQRIVKGQAMNFHVPVHFTGGDTSPGKKNGGVISTLVTDIEISCLPRQLPEYIELDISGMEIGDSLRLSDLNLPEGVSIPTHGQEDALERVIVNMQPPRVEKAESSDDEVAADEVPATEVKDEGEE